MANLSQKEIRQKTPWLFGLLLLVNFVLMAWNAKDPASENSIVRVWIQAVASPVQSGVAVVSNNVGGFFGDLLAWRAAVTENRSLKEQVDQLQVEVQQRQALQTENERLRGLLDLKSQSDYKTVPAMVIGRDSSAWFDAVMINRGSSAGVDLNMPVITAEGVVGRVVAVSPISAQVALLSDNKSAVGAVVGQIGNNSISPIKGTGKSEFLEMNYVSGVEPVEVGMPVLTTGQDGIYPPGLKIGEIAEVRAGSATSPHQILVKPNVPAGSLKEVSVVLYQPPAQPAPEKSLPNVKTQSGKKKNR